MELTNHFIYINQRIRACIMLLPDPDLTSAFPVLISFVWLIVFFVGGTYVFWPFEVLSPVIKVYELFEVCDPLCAPFVFKTALCDPFERTRPFIWPISYFGLFTCTVIFCFWVCYRGAHPFSVFWSLVPLFQFD